MAYIEISKYEVALNKARLYERAMGHAAVLGSNPHDELVADTSREYFNTFSKEFKKAMKELGTLSPK